jgi:hypothetical protein
MTLQENQQKLHEFNVFIRRLLEEAELRIPRINQIIEQVAIVGLAADLVLMGGVVAQLPYAASHGPHDSGQVLQAVLVVPGGIGVAIWDSEELIQFRNLPEPPAHQIRARFVRFDDMLAAEKALIMLHAGPLLLRLCSVVLPVAAGVSGAASNQDRSTTEDNPS